MNTQATTTTDTKTDAITVNGIAVDLESWPSGELAVVHELVFQRAQELGLIGKDADDSAIEQAIERTLAEEVMVPEPDHDECQRWYEANKKRYRTGELVHARHILFQVTPGAPVTSITSVAEVVLQELRSNPELFEDRCKKNSNCPSSEHGGNLGQLQRGETVPEFEKAIFDTTQTGILPNLITSRHGFHIVAVDRRIEGKQLPFDMVKEEVAAELKKRSEARALTQYITLLAADANIEGIEFDAATSPLVQ